MPEERLLHSKQLQLRKARLVDDLNTKITHWPATIEMIQKNILPVDFSIEQAITGKSQLLIGSQ